MVERLTELRVSELQFFKSRKTANKVATLVRTSIFQNSRSMVVCVLKSCKTSLNFIILNIITLLNKRL